MGDDDEERAVVADAVTASVLAAVILAFGTWVLWVSRGVAEYESHQDDLKTLVRDVGEIKGDVGYLRGRIEKKE